MTQKKQLYHALKINEEICVGCTHCMLKCPTEAIRIRDGKAHIISDWCVDCGECLKSCPVEAIYVEQDDFAKIFDYECRVALVPTVFIGQFSKSMTEKQIYSALYSLGFTHIFQVEFSVELVRNKMAQAMSTSDIKPYISSFCPAIVRLIQLRFPDLVDNILPIEQPVNATAKLYIEQLLSDGFRREQIGMFYVTPCASKIASIKSHTSSRQSIDGVINMNFLYNKVFHIINNQIDILPDNVGVIPPELSSVEMRWSLSGGEIANFEGRGLAIDEIHNVIDFLERMESTDEIIDVDFLELRACDKSCVGGVLTPMNRFLADERVVKRAALAPSQTLLYTSVSKKTINFVNENLQLKPIKPMTKLLYTGNINEVLRKMESARGIMCFLPGMDCGACGSPGCHALADDIVDHKARISNCVFMQRIMEQRGTFGREQAYRIIESIWGQKRLSKNCYKKGAKYEGE